MKKNKKILTYTAFSIIVILCLYLIYKGTNGLALSPRKEVFTIKTGEVMKLDPGYYLKGVSDPDRIKIDFSKVNNKEPGEYQVQAKQSGRIYTFTIKVTK